jgi:hypothetical protein
MVDYAASVADMVFVQNHVPVFQMEPFPPHRLSILQLWAMLTQGLMLIHITLFAISPALMAIVPHQMHVYSPSPSTRMKRTLSLHYLPSIIVM